MTKNEQQLFANKFVELFLANGFGSMTKHEIEILVFHLLHSTYDYRDKSNYELATLLKIPEAKVKSLRLAAALKYETINHKAVLGKIIMRLANNYQYANVSNGKVELSLEDPIEKRELEHYLKSNGYHAEYTLNSELLRIAPIRLFELLIDNMENGAEEFDRLVRENIDDNMVSTRILEGAPTLLQKLQRLRKEALNTNTLLSLLSGTVGVLIANPVPSNN